jgi:hypothetical protein
MRVEARPRAAGKRSANLQRVLATSNRVLDANVLRAYAQLSDGNRERDAQTNPADDPSKAVGESDTHVVGEENGPQAHGEMADDEPRGEGIMGDESNVPRIMQ